MNGVIDDIAQDEPQKEPGSRTAEQHQASTPDQGGNRQAHRERHHVAHGIIGVIVMIAVNQEDKPSCRGPLYLQMKEVSVHRIFEKRPDEEARRKQAEPCPESGFPPSCPGDQREQYAPDERENSWRNQRKLFQMFIFEQSDSSGLVIGRAHYAELEQEAPLSVKELCR